MAQSRVDAVDYQLDETVDELAKQMERVVRRDRKHPRWTRYLRGHY